MQNEKPARVKIGGLWNQETKNGLPYISGDFTFGSRIEIWPNKKRDGKQDPDFTAYIVEKVKKESAVKPIEEVKWPDFPHNDVPKYNPQDKDVPF